MGCSIHADLANAPRAKVSVNGVVIPHDEIARETQNHPAHSPAAAWHEAALSLVVRELLLQEAQRAAITASPAPDVDGRLETPEEANIRALIERFVVTPAPDDDSCRRYYDRNRDKFRTPTIYEAAHILLSVSRNENVAFEAKRRDAHAIISALREDPSRFAHLARAYSICPSSADGGNLGQLLPGDTTAEFERALASLQPGEITQAPVETRYGFHIIRLDRRIEGAELPFEPVKERIANYLRAATITQARALYVRMLVEQANIEGLELASSRTRTPRDNDAPIGALRT